MDDKEKQYIEEFKTYLSVEKNFSEHTLTAYCSDIVSYILWLNGEDCTNINFEKLREYLHFIQRFEYKKTTIARKTASIRTVYKFLFREKYMIQIQHFLCRLQNGQNHYLNFSPRKKLSKS